MDTGRSIWVLGTLLLSASCPLWAAAVSEQIVVDQFGWRPAASRRVVIFANPLRGQNSGRPYVPGSVFQIRRVSDDGVAYSGQVVSWRNGATDSYSGDQVWWGDFSDFNTPGDYVVYDPAHDLQSYPFAVRDTIYADVLKTAARMFYYQRCGVDIPQTYGGNWTHAACHVGVGQDRAAQLYVTSAQGNARDISGGWHDAGDYNKYAAWTAGPVWDLMMAFELRPSVFGDNWNIPESGNRVPDILDEVKWELDWLLRMQLADGSVSNRVAVASYNAGTGPTVDTQPRYYTQPTTWATATLCGLAAHAARAFKPYESTYPGYCDTLAGASQKAWQYLRAHPSMTPATGKDGPTLAAGDAGADAAADKRLRIYAAAELYKTTGDAECHEYFKANYKDPAASDNGYHPLIQNQWDASLAWDLNRSYVVYATTRGADSSIAATVRASLRNTMNWTIAARYTSGDDAYRGFMWEGHYCWGSNQLRANWAKLALFAAALDVNPAQSALYREIAEEYLHFFHGRNALSYVYLSNMGDKGARLTKGKSPMEIYHGWFQDGSRFYDGIDSASGPAPGYLVGGPNKFFGLSWISPPYGEPPAKAFKDWNTGWNASRNANENSWEITEPSISYQGAYVLVLAQFVPDFATPPQ